MKTVVISTFLIFLLAGCILLYRDFFVKRKLRKLVAERYKVVAPLIHKLESKEPISTEEVLLMVKDPALRLGVFHVLEVHKRSDLFPAEYFTREKGAEGYLVNWLEFPTELGVPPNEIEFLTIVTLKDIVPLDYYVFKYKKKLPHKAIQDDWMMGVCGPYHAGSKPYDIPLRVFSRFYTIDQISPELEVQWVHNAIHKT